MKINIKTTNIELTDALSQYVDEKATQIEKFLDADDETVLCEIEIGTSSKHHQSGDIFKAEIDLRAAGGNFRAVSDKEDLYIAINDAKEDIIRAVKSHREKIRTQEKQGGAAVKNMLKGID